MINEKNPIMKIHLNIEKEKKGREKRLRMNTERQV